MPKSDTLWNHPIKTLEQVLHIRKEIEALKARLGELLRGEFTIEVTLHPRAGKKTTFSTATLAKMRAAQQARWAKVRNDFAEPSKSSVKKKVPTKVAKTGGISPEGRARLAAAMKARWAARKSGAPAPNAKARG